MNRKHNSLTAKFIMLAVALLVALTAMSVGYAKWSDSTLINGKVEMGTWDTELQGGFGEGINVAVIDEDTLEVTIASPVTGVPYQAPFSVVNTGTVPVRIQNIAYAAPAGVSVGISGIAQGAYVNAGTVKTGFVTVASTDENITLIVFQITIERILWDAYVP